MVQITPVVPVAKAVGSTRIVRGHGIVSPVGNSELSREGDLALRRNLVRQALERLTKEGTATS